VGAGRLRGQLFSFLFVENIVIIVEVRTCEAGYDFTIWTGSEKNRTLPSFKSIVQKGKRNTNDKDGATPKIVSVRTERGRRLVCTFELDLPSAAS